MTTLLIFIIIFAIILAITGGLVEGLGFLLWIGLLLGVIAVIGWAIRSIRARGNQ